MKPFLNNILVDSSLAKLNEKLAEELSEEYQLALSQTIELEKVLGLSV